MRHHFLYILLGVIIGASGVCGYRYYSKPQPTKPKQATYLDMIAAPEGEYGKPVLAMAKAHTAIYNNFVHKTKSLKVGEVHTVVDPYGTVALAGLIGLRTPEPATIKITLKIDDKTPPVKYETKELTTVHIIPALGLLADTANKVELISYNKDGQPIKTYGVVLKTEPLSDKFHGPEVIQPKDGAYHNQFYFMNVAEGSGMGPRTAAWFGFDEKGRVRWAFNEKYGAAFLMKPWKDGMWLALMPNKIAGVSGWGTKYMMAFDLTGRIYNVWYAPERLHHDFKILKNGRIVIASDGHGQVEDVSLEGTLPEDESYLRNIIALDLNDVINPRRVTLDNRGTPLEKLDWFHMNGVDQNPVHDYVVYSGRSQSATVAVNPDHTLRWILADHTGWPKDMQPYLLKPVGQDFEWSWGQHSPVFRDAKHLFLFDNGNFRSVDFDTALKAHENYSRLVEYKIDEKTKTIKQVWSYGKERGNELYAPYVGGVDYLPESKTVVGVFGGILKTRLGNPSDVVEGNSYKNSAHIIELTHTMPPKVVAEYAFRDHSYTTNGFMVYRGAVCHIYCAYGK